MKRGRNAVTLAEHNSFAFDSRVEFEEERHEYHVDGVLVPRSVSAVVADGFGDKFDPELTIARHLASWRNKRDSKYHAVVAGKTDEQAREAVLQMWEAGREAGTLLHKHAELLLNGEQPSCGVSPAESELLLEGWSMLQKAGHQIVRTELSVFWPPRGKAHVAGQIDFLTRTPRGLAIVDLKRSSQDLTAGAYSYGRTGRGVLATVGHTKHMTYSLQLSLYAVMLTELLREPVAELLLLQLDPEEQRCRVIPCADLRPQAKALLLSAAQTAAEEDAASVPD